MRIQIVIAAAALLAGCASTHDLSTGPGLLGGGIQKTEELPGFYWILARTNEAPWENLSGAKSSWIEVAESVCGRGQFTEIAITEQAINRGSHPTMQAISMILSERRGYALCRSAKTSMEEALAFAEARK